MRGNLVRILPDGLQAVIDTASWPIPPIFDYLQKTGDVAKPDMFQAFNMGIGYVLVVAEHLAENVVERLKSSGERPYVIGTITEGTKDVILKD